jgi:hypothetical protein
MNTIGVPLLLLLLPAAEGKSVPKVPVGKETTYVTGPIDDDGFIDYETALNERLSKGIRPDRNANVLLWKALGPRPEGGKRMPPEFFRWLGIDEPPERGAYFIGLHLYLQEHLKLDERERDAVVDQEGRATRRAWTANEYPHIAAWLKANEKPLALVIEATQRPDYFSPLLRGRPDKEQGGLFSAPRPAVQKCRELASALVARALLRVGEKDFDAAWQDLLACHRLGRLVARGATLIEGLVGIAIDQVAANADLEYLDRARLPPKQVRECLRDLQKLPAMPAMVDKIDLGERFACLDMLQSLRRGGLGIMDVDRGGPLPASADPSELKALEKIDWAPAFRLCNHWYDRLAVTLRVTDRAERQQRLRRMDDDLEALVKEAAKHWDEAKRLAWLLPPGKAVGTMIGSLVVGLAIPSAAKVENAFDRDEQVQQNVQLAFALAAYRGDHDRYPAKLDELAPKYLPAVPGDLFSGKALIYRPRADGYLLYSVGVNGKDDDGRWLDDTPPGDDLRVRTPPPELKRPR